MGVAVELLIIQVEGLWCVSLRAEKTESLTSSKMDFTQCMSEIFGETKVYNSTWGSRRVLPNPSSHELLTRLQVGRPGQPPYKLHLSLEKSFSEDLT